MSQLRIVTRAVAAAAVALAAAAAAPSAASAQQASGMAGKNVVQVATEAGTFETLVAAVKAAGLAETLQGEGPFTVVGFAPPAPITSAAITLPGTTW